MAQKTIKDYFPSRKIQDRGKNATNKRSLESFTVPRSKRRRVTKVLTSQQEDKFSHRDEREDNVSLRSTRTRSTSSLRSTPTASSSEILSPIREATPAGGKSSSTKLNCLETLSLTVSPLRRGAECVRLALEKKTSSPVKLGKEATSTMKGKTETRRKLFSEDSGATIESKADGKEISVFKCCMTFIYLH